MKAIKIILINLFIFFLLLCIVDPFLSESANPMFARNVILREWPRNLDKNFRPSEQYLKGVDNLENKEYRVSTDDNAFISISNSEAKDKPVDIIFYGGSTTECLYVDEEKRFPYLTGKLLEKEFGIPFHTLNAGMSSNNSMHCSISLIAKGLPHKPKAVVLMHNINDLVLLTKTGTYWNAPQTRAIIQTDEVKTARYSIGGRLRLFVKATKDLLFPNLFYRISKIFTVNMQEEADEWETYRQVAKYDFKEIEDQFSSSINSFIKIAKSFHIEVILMTQFSRLYPEDKFVREHYKNEVDYELFCSYFSKFNEKIRQIAKDENLLLVDLEKEIPSNKDHIYDAVHLNSNGSVLVSSIIAKEIRKNFDAELRRKEPESTEQN